jgi:hypothetical protein
MCYKKENVNSVIVPSFFHACACIFSQIQMQFIETKKLYLFIIRVFLAKFFIKN